MNEKLLELIKENKVLIIEKGEPVRFTDEWKKELNKWKLKKQNKRNEKTT